MKRNDLNAIITGIVHRYIEDGWVLEMCNSSYSDVVGVHFLSRGRERVFFKVDGDWYVDDVREADGAMVVRHDRVMRDFYRNSSPHPFHPTKAFLDKWVRGMYGWKNVEPSDVVITKETCADGIYYCVRKTVGNGDCFSVASFGKR